MKNFIFFLIPILIGTVFLTEPAIGQIGSVRIDGFELVGHLPYLQHSKLWESRAWSLSQIFRVVKDDGNAKLVIYAWRNRVQYQERFRNAGAALDGGAAVALGNEAKERAISAGVPESRIDVRYRPQADEAGVEFIIEHPARDPLLEGLETALIAFIGEEGRRWNAQGRKDQGQDRRLDALEARRGRTYLGLGGTATLFSNETVPLGTATLRFGKRSVLQIAVSYGEADSSDVFAIGGDFGPWVAHLSERIEMTPLLSAQYLRDFNPQTNYQRAQFFQLGPKVEVAVDLSDDFKLSVSGGGLWGGRRDADGLKNGWTGVIQGSIFFEIN